MKSKFLVLMLSVIMSAMMATSAFAEFVYVTKNGKKYHHAESRFIKNRDAEKITLEEAKERGLEPSQAYLKFKASLEGSKSGEKASSKKSEKLDKKS